MSRIEIVKEGITHLHTAAVVNAANEFLQEGGGVCGVIFNAAGAERLQQACNEIGGCPTGSAVITPAFDLDAKYIIHAVGPKWHGGSHGEPDFLYGAYYRALELAAENGCRSIGFPLISAGIYGYPVDKAWEVAMSACKAFMYEKTDVNLLIRFGVPNEENREIGKMVYKKIFEEEMEERIPTSFSIPESTLEKLERLADQFGFTPSDLITDMIEHLAVEISQSQQ